MNDDDDDEEENLIKYNKQYQRFKMFVSQWTRATWYFFFALTSTTHIRVFIYIKL